MYPSIYQAAMIRRRHLNIGDLANGASVTLHIHLPSRL